MTDEKTANFRQEINTDKPCEQCKEYFQRGEIWECELLEFEISDWVKSPFHHTCDEWSYLRKK